MESTDVMYAKERGKFIKRGNNVVLDDQDYDIGNLLLNNGRKPCPKCRKSMQKSGQKADSNGVVKQRFLCPFCKRQGRTPYNYFFPVEIAS